jgi:hypothetical protein
VGFFIFLKRVHNYYSGHREQQRSYKRIQGR